MIAKVEEVTFFKISREVERLLELLEENDETQAVEMMKQIVPEFVSNSSRFEELDKLKVTAKS